MLSKDVAVLEGLLGLGLLILFQFCITFISVRIKRFEELIKSKPTLIYAGDAFLTDVMQNHRVTRAEVLAAVRGSSISSLTVVKFVVLETDGSFSVIKKTNAESDNSALQNVEHVNKHTT